MIDICASTTEYSLIEMLFCHRFFIIPSEKLHQIGNSLMRTKCEFCFILILPVLHRIFLIKMCIQRFLDGISMRNQKKIISMFKWKKKIQEEETYFSGQLPKLFVEAELFDGILLMKDWASLSVNCSNPKRIIRLKYMLSNLNSAK